MYTDKAQISPSPKVQVSSRPNQKFTKPAAKEDQNFASSVTNISISSVLPVLYCYQKNPLWCNHISCTAPFRSVFQQQFPVINSYFLPYLILYARTHYAPVHNFLEYVYWFVLRNWPPARKPNFCFSMLKKYQLSQMVPNFFNLQKA